MKIAVFADIHDNMLRWDEAKKIIATENIKTGVCLGDVSNLENLIEISKSFAKLYLTFGNMDYNLKFQTELFPKNVEWFEKEGEIEIAKKKIGIVHFDYLAKKMVNENKYDLVLYGHTHTPWEKKIGKTVLLNPGEIAGQFGPASFAIYDLSKMKAKLVILK